MQSSTCKFLMGLGVGSLLGMVAYRCSKTAKAKEWRQKMCCAAHSAAEKAGEWMTNVKAKATDMAGKMADEVAEKAGEAKDKFQSYSGK